MDSAFPNRMGRAVSVVFEAYNQSFPAQCESPCDDAPLLEDAVLEELIAEVGISTFLDFVGRMASAALDHHARLARALAAQDADATQRAAHALCGLLGHFGLTRAARLSHAIENAKAGPDACAMLAAVLQTSLEALPQYARRLAS